jgi:RNA polymerase sigma-54 factor
MTPVLGRLIDNLSLLGDGNLPALAAACGVDVAEIDGLVGRLRHLNPHPGVAFAEEMVEIRVPDLLLRPSPGGGWTLELNPETLPRAMVDRAYATELRAGQLTSDERTYVREQVQAASWLVRAMEQRATTLLTVAAEALRRQEHWLTDPEIPRRPLTMGDLGAALDMHVSTVSRAVSGKHVAAPGGLIALRDCFVGGLATAAGGMSAGEIQQALAALVDGETAPLSDAALARALADAGMPVARRTVAKYRDELGIPPSAGRQKLKSGSLPEGQRCSMGGRSGGCALFRGQDVTIRKLAYE